MKASIFLGPSLPLAEAQRLLPDAIFHPPAEQGDLLAAVDQDGATVLGLIDGTFHQNLSVWHNEVCYLLSRGIAIYGASSMGALRAVETERFGMAGVGTVYTWYRDGVIQGDDEVALLHGDATTGYRALSLPLVNIRASVAQAVVRQLLASRHAEALLAIAQNLYYPERRATTILQLCREAGFPESQLAAAAQALTTGYVDVKRADACALLAAVAQVMAGTVPLPKPPHFEFARSSMFETLYNLDRKVRVESDEVTLQAMAEHVALHSNEFKTLRTATLDREMVVFLGRLLDVRVTAEEVDEERKTFLAERGLETPEALTGWLRANAYCEGDLTEYLMQEAVCHRLRRWALTARSFDRGAKALLDELRMRGSFPYWAKETADAAAIAAAYEHEPEYRAIWAEHPAVIAEQHAANGNVRILGDAAVWAEEAGFDTVEGLADALRRAVIVQDVRKRIARSREFFEQALRLFPAS